MAELLLLSLQTFVEVQQWAINHSETYWKDPWAFRPERFLAASSDEAHEAGNTLDALQPFSLGPRNCIGRKYVMLSLPPFLPSPERNAYEVNQIKVDGQLTDQTNLVSPTPRCVSF